MRNLHQLTTIVRYKDMMKFPAIVTVCISLSLCGCLSKSSKNEENLLAEEEPEPDPVRDYRVSIMECLVQPTKSTGENWDASFGSILGVGGAIIADTVVPGSGRIAAPVIAVIKAKGVTGKPAPDLYLRISWRDETLLGMTDMKASTPIAKNSFHAIWNRSFYVEGRSTTRIRIEVWDRDIKDHDPVGATSFSIKQANDAGGLLRLKDFGQVVELTVEVVPTGPWYKRK